MSKYSNQNYRVQYSFIKMLLESAEREYRKYNISEIQINGVSIQDFIKKSNPSKRRVIESEYNNDLYNSVCISLTYEISFFVGRSYKGYNIQPYIKENRVKVNHWENKELIQNLSLIAELMQKALEMCQKENELIKSNSNQNKVTQ